MHRKMERIHACAIGAKGEGLKDVQQQRSIFQSMGYFKTRRWVLPV